MKAANKGTQLRIASHSQGLSVGADGLSPACKVQQFCMELVGCPSSGIREMRCEGPKVFLSLNC